MIFKNTALVSLSEPLRFGEIIQFGFGLYLFAFKIVFHHSIVVQIGRLSGRRAFQMVISLLTTV